MQTVSDEALAELPEGGEYHEITSAADNGMTRVVDWFSGRQYLGRRIGGILVWRLVSPYSFLPNVPAPATP